MFQNKVNDDTYFDLALLKVIKASVLKGSLASAINFSNIKNECNWHFSNINKISEQPLLPLILSILWKDLAFLSLDIYLQVLNEDIGHISGDVEGEINILMI